MYRQQVADSLKYLLPVLDSVLYYDQKYRIDNDTKLYFDNQKAVRAIDSSNVAIVSGVLDRYGFLDITDIGANGSLALVIVIIHAPLGVQQKYLPVFRKALADKKKIIIPAHYAMLEDKIAVQQKKPQVFGTRVMVSGKKSKGEVWPLIEPDSVDARRKSIGMPETMDMYLKRFGLEWNLKKYKKELPALRKNTASAIKPVCPGTQGNGPNALYPGIFLHLLVQASGFLSH